MKKITKKLTLNKQTIATLGSNGQRFVLAGANYTALRDECATVVFNTCVGCTDDCSDGCSVGCVTDTCTAAPTCPASCNATCTCPITDRPRPSAIIRNTICVRA